MNIRFDFSAVEGAVGQLHPGVVARRVVVIGTSLLPDPHTAPHSCLSPDWKDWFLGAIFGLLNPFRLKL